MVNLNLNASGQNQFENTQNKRSRSYIIGDQSYAFDMDSPRKPINPSSNN